MEIFVLQKTKNSIEVKDLVNEAKLFCQEQSNVNHVDLLGVTDGKAVGTYVEHKFKKFLSDKYDIEIGNSAAGIDLPSKNINTDIKVTSIRQPQSSCPYKSARQKIYGLGYNLLIFVYDKIDYKNTCNLQFLNCTFVEMHRTADYTTTKRIIELLKDGAGKEDLIAYFEDRNIPGDEIAYENLANEIIKTPPIQGYLTISNALQWRLQYSRVIDLKNLINGVINIDWRK